MYEYLESQYSIQITRGKRYLEAVAATQTEAELLGVNVGAPMILLGQRQLLAGWYPAWSIIMRFIEVIAPVLKLS